MQQNNIIIKKMLLIPTSHQYKDIYQRNFTLNIDHTNVNKLEAVLAQSGVGQNRVISDITMAASMPEIMSLNPHAGNRVEVPNGWGTVRLRFMMEVESNFNGNLVSSYLQGYSEYHDPSLTGRVDPHMLFYINSITDITRTYDPTTGQYYSRSTGTYNVITDLVGGTKYEEIDGPNNGLKLIRPNDLISDIMNNDIYGDALVYNGTGGVANKTNTSSRANNDPVKYFTKTINSFVEAKSDSAITYDLTDVLRTAGTITQEQHVMNNPFVSALSKLTRQISPTTFNLDMLTSLDPNTQNVVMLIDNRTELVQSTNTMLDTNDTADTYQSNIETTTATNVAQSVTSYMLDTMLTKLDFSFTNKTGENVVIVSAADSFIDGIDITAYVNKLVTKIKTVLMPTVTYNSQMIIECFVHSDVVGDTTVSVSLNMQPNTIYRFPTFADSLYSPVVTDNSTRNTLADDFSSVLDITYKVGPQL